MRDLASIVCGASTNLGELSSVLAQLANSIALLGGRCVRFIQDKDQKDLTFFGPFCGRSVLELSVVAVIARLDPLRVLVVKRCQQQPTYDLSQRHRIAIQWSGDVLSAEKLPPNLWDSSVVTAKGQVRALFGDHFGELHWRPGFESLLDSELVATPTEIVKDLQQVQPEGITTYLRTEADQLYSSLSKGIHQEFVVPVELIYDRDTVKDLLIRTLVLIAKLGLLSHCISTALGRLPTSKLIAKVQRVERSIGL